MTAGQLQVDVWGDLACPWCYIGKNRLDQAISSSPHAGAITVVTRSFELDPAMPDDVKPNLDVLSAKYGLSLAQASATCSPAVPMGGLPLAWMG
jgi:predicted DsbA family dithiol-disulfide isomerase